MGEEEPDDDDPEARAAWLIANPDKAPRRPDTQSIDFRAVFHDDDERMLAMLQDSLAGVTLADDLTQAVASDMAREHVEDKSEAVEKIKKMGVDE